MVTINNSFTKKPHVFQIFTYFLYPARIAIYFLIIFSCYTSQILATVLTLILHAIGLVTLVAWFKASYTDPTDEVLMAERRANALG
jgi:hypothetical protein